MPDPETARNDLGRGVFLRTLFWPASYRIRSVARKHGISYRYPFIHPDGVELAELADLESGRAKGKVAVEITGGSHS